MAFLPACAGMMRPYPYFESCRLAVLPSAWQSSLTISAVHVPGCDPMVRVCRSGTCAPASSPLARFPSSDLGRRLRRLRLATFTLQRICDGLPCGSPWIMALPKKSDSFSRRFDLAVSMSLHAPGFPSGSTLRYLQVSLTGLTEPWTSVGLRHQACACPTAVTVESFGAKISSVRHPLSPASPAECAFRFCGEPHPLQHTMYPVRPTNPLSSGSAFYRGSS